MGEGKGKRKPISLVSLFYLNAVSSVLAAQIIRKTQQKKRNVYLGCASVHKA